MQRFRLVFGVAALALGSLALACGKDHPPPLADISAAQNSTSPRATADRGAVRTGPCDGEGATAACHIETGRHAGVVNCFSGTQICTAGQWGACQGASNGTLSTHSFPSQTSEMSGGFALVTVTGTTSASGCVDNPCNPYCLGVDHDAGALQQDGGFTASSVVADVTSFSLLPPAKTVANAASCSTSATSTSQCSYDMCCDTSGSDAGAGVGACVPRPNNTTCSPCAGADYQIAVGCVDAGGQTRIAVCNRGTANSPTTGSLLVSAFPGNPPTAGTAAVCDSPTGSQGTCTIDLAQHPLAADECIDLSFTAPAAGISCTGNFSGNRWLMVNDDFSQNECNRCNNFSFNSAAGAGACASYNTRPPPAATVVEEYSAVCGPGAHVRWNQFAYDTLVPSASDVRFSVRTSPRGSDPSLRTFSSSVLVGQPSTEPSATSADPAVCPMSGTVAGCPKSLYAGLLPLGAATNEILELSVTLTAGTALPTVRSWSLSYDCVPAE